jgi:hypothetical protein
MIEPKKRGRPAIPAAEKKARNFTFRSRGDLHERLSGAAAANQRSISEEIEHRIEQSFQIEQRIEEMRSQFNQRIQVVEAEAKLGMARVAEAAEQKNASLRERLDEFERELEKHDAAAAMVDVLLGQDKVKSGLLRAVALQLAEVPSDRVLDAATARQLVESAASMVWPQAKGASR